MHAVSSAVTQASDAATLLKPCSDAVNLPCLCFQKQRGPDTMLLSIWLQQIAAVTGGKLSTSIYSPGSIHQVDKGDSQPLSVLQPIQVQTSPNVVETAVMHIMEVQSNTAEMRLTAMHEINPLHTFMFSNRGKMLNANQAAIEACMYSGGQRFSLQFIQFMCSKCMLDRLSRRS